MTRILLAAASGVALLAGVQTASAQDFGSCNREAAAAREECFAGGPRDRARAAECTALYREDIAECRRFGRDRDRRW